jgi:hypothetical protein
MNELDNLPDGFYWGQTKAFGVWRMLRKSTDRQTWGQPWKDLESGKRVTYQEIRDRYERLVEVKHP